MPARTSSSYFTPQELVDLIIERTLKPLAEERINTFKTKAEELKNDDRPIAEQLTDLQNFDPAEAVLELKVLDPAMGSGHFLVTAVDFLADHIAEFTEHTPGLPEWLNGEYTSPLVERIDAIRDDIIQRARDSGWTLDEAQLTDQTIIRRMVLKRCIYGVDKNPLTVELAKVSLWLHSFTVGAPLSFLGPPPALRRRACGPESGRGYEAAEPPGWAVRQPRHSRSRSRHGQYATHRGNVRRRHIGSQGIGIPLPRGGGYNGRPPQFAGSPERDGMADGRDESKRAQSLRVPLGKRTGRAARASI